MLQESHVLRDREQIEKMRTNSILHRLKEKECITSRQYELITKVLKLCNAAIHGLLNAKYKGEAGHKLQFYLTGAALNR